MKKRKFSAKFKAQVAIEAIKERESLVELAKRFGIYPNQISAWKKEFLERSDMAFGGPPPAPEIKDLQQEREELYRKIGELEMKCEFF
jgi:transposase-like protein